MYTPLIAYHIPDPNIYRFHTDDLCRRCANERLIEGLILVFKANPLDIPGYFTLSPEAKEQIRLAFEIGRVPNKSFEGTEVTNVHRYYLEVARSDKASCIRSDCRKNRVKIAEGNLRVAFTVSFVGHNTDKYKHW